MFCYCQQGDQGGPVVVGYPGSEVLVGIISGNQHNCIDYFEYVILPICFSTSFFINFYIKYCNYFLFANLVASQIQLK